jgi:hypothetical protein
MPDFESQKRIQQDIRIFRMGEEIRKEKKSTGYQHGRGDVTADPRRGIQTPPGVILRLPGRRIFFECVEIIQPYGGYILRPEPIP